MFELAQRTRKEVVGIIEPEQRKRLNQIQTQQNWVTTFTNPIAAKRLNLNDEQKGKVRTILNAAATERRKIEEATEGNREEGKRNVADQIKSVLKVLRSVLDAEQNRTLDDLLGDPFRGRLPPVNDGEVKGGAPPGE